MLCLTKTISIEDVAIEVFLKWHTKVLNKINSEAPPVYVPVL